MIDVTPLPSNKPSITITKLGIEMTSIIRCMIMSTSTNITKSNHKLHQSRSINVATMAIRSEIRTPTMIRFQHSSKLSVPRINLVPSGTP